ncbi:MAG TPA: NlpC/P60 family protein [Acidimicrobiales bacterium]|nr:NlpC/P60 family protein [Acidimicrobiales bacterium]
MDRAGASQPVSTLRSKAAALAAKISTIQVELQVLSEEYDQAATREALIVRDIRKDERSIASTQSSVSEDKQSLQRQAIDAYVNDATASEVFSALTAQENALPAQQAYLQAAAGNLSTAVSSLRISEHALVERTAQLERDEAQSRSTLQTLTAARASATTLDAQLTSTLQGVNGSLAAAVAEQQQEQATQAAAQAAAAQLIQRAQRLSDAGSAPDPAATTSATAGDGPGLAAVRAAESQIGVPYVWSGASPGYGFDCSGLAMWAWAQAGVSLPHSAGDQYDSIEHIPFSELQPGDLIFYAADGYIYHVVIYVGDGNVVQAEETGTRISITPIPPDPYAAGRP